MGKPPKTPKPPPLYLRDVAPGRRVVVRERMDGDEYREMWFRRESDEGRTMHPNFVATTRLRTIQGVPGDAWRRYDAAGEFADPGQSHGLTSVVLDSLFEQLSPGVPDPMDSHLALDEVG